MEQEEVSRKGQSMKAVWKYAENATHNWMNEAGLM